MLNLKSALLTLLILIPFLISILVKDNLIIGYLSSVILGVVVYYFQKKYKKIYLTQNNLLMLLFLSSLLLFLKSFFN
jgi:hypothetical protein